MHDTGRYHAQRTEVAGEKGYSSCDEENARILHFKTIYYETLFHTWNFYDLIDYETERARRFTKCNEIQDVDRRPTRCRRIGRSAGRSVLYPSLLVAG